MLSHWCLPSTHMSLAHTRPPTTMNRIKYNITKAELHENPFCIYLFSLNSVLLIPIIINICMYYILFLIQCLPPQLCFYYKSDTSLKKMAKHAKMCKEKSKTTLHTIQHLYAWGNCQWQGWLLDLLHTHTHTHIHAYTVCSFYIMGSYTYHCAVCSPHSVIRCRQMKQTNTILLKSHWVSFIRIYHNLFFYKYATDKYLDYFQSLSFSKV